ncbi:hypothetical protein M0R72_13085, partial [Candidatus Pacearchaeota archaeon]|nr:hypothetical protein [Candidatus Pacearchaeota archaeon]
MAGSKNLWIEVPPSVAHANIAVLFTGDGFPDVFWDNVLATGADIIIYDNAGNKLPRQLVAINTGAKTMKLYVKSPSSATAKTYLRMEYDDAGGAEANDFADYEDYHETYSARVAASADDCLVYFNNVNWIFDNIAVTVQVVGYITNTLKKYGGGMRFLNANLPKDSHICPSYLTVTAAEAHALNAVKTYITGELTDGGTFSSLANYQGRRGVVVGGASDDYITTTQVAWDNIVAFVVDTTYQSTDIASVIQEQVDNAAQINLVLFWDDHDARGTQGTN